jgi:hypothetical protein
MFSIVSQLRYNTEHSRIMAQIEEVYQPLLSYSPSESPFIERVRRTIRLKQMSRCTEKSYLYYVLDYIYFHLEAKSPRHGH